MGHKTLIGGTAYDIKKGKTLIGGTGYDIKKGRTLIGGTAYDISFGTPLDELAAKTSVYMNVNGVRTEWKVAHQGNPDTEIYDASCNGTWLLMKDIYTTMSFSSSTYNENAYAASNVHTYLNNTFLGLLDTDIKTVIKQVIIPVSGPGGARCTLFTGANGLSTKVFLLSSYECGKTGLNINAEGAALDYFTSDDDRIAYLDGSASAWTTRSPETRASSNFWSFTASGGTSRTTATSSSNGIRPAMIFDSEATLVDSEFNIIVA